MARILYITYDGLLEPLGQSQVWQYLRRLARDHTIVLLSFEKSRDAKNAPRMAAMRAACQKAGIRWTALRYHKHPTVPATAFDVISGIMVGFFLALRHRIAIVHARSYVAALMAISLKRAVGLKFVFDMRGFWADERVEGGLWPANSQLYRAAKALERHFLLRSDAIVSLTHTAVETMRSFSYLNSIPLRFEVIPTCADLQLFSPSENELPRKPFTLGYVGSVGVWYQFEDVISVFKEVLKFLPDARLVIVNRGDHAAIDRALKTAAVPPTHCDVLSADHHEVPALIRRFHAAAFFYRPTFSKVATAPTKLAEFLGVGIPVLVNSRVGDMARIVCNNNLPVGVVIDQFSLETLARAARDIVKLAAEIDIRDRCREVALRHFSVEDGSARYSALYRALEAAG